MVRKILTYKKEDDNMDEMMRICPECGREVSRDNMAFTRDCQGITFRLLCIDCYDKVMNNEPFFDGQYYDEFDENIEPDF